jgi:O-antigen/teichoic acid export membrane protein
VNKSFLWFLVPTLLQTILGVSAMVPITTYYLDPADLGIFAILTTLAMPVTPLSSVGDSWVLSAHWYQATSSGRRELLFNLIAANIVLKLAWIAVFWTLAPLVLPELVREYRPEYQLYFRFALLGLLAGTLWPTISSLMVIERAPISHALNESLQWLTAALTTVVGLSVMKLGVLAIFLSPIAGGIVSTVHGLWYVAPKLSVQPRLRWLGEIVKSGMPALPFSLMDVIANSVDRIVIQRWLDLSALGIYAHSQSYRGMFIAVTKAYSRTMTPAFLELYVPGVTRANSPVKETASLWYWSVTAGGILVTLFAPEVIHLLTHGKFDQAADLVPIWFLLVFAHSIGVPFTQYLLSVRQSVLMSWVSIVISLGSMLLVAISTWEFGIMGATGAAVAGVFILHFTRYMLARRLNCPYRFEAGVLWGIITILALYLLTRWTAVPLPIKFLMAAVVIAMVGTRLMRQVSFHDVLTSLVPKK